MNQYSNPFHQYNTRNKPNPPIRMNAVVSWQPSNYVPVTNNTQTNKTVTTYSPLIFINKK